VKSLQQAALAGNARWLDSHSDASAAEFNTTDLCIRIGQKSEGGDNILLATQEQ
jgi:hypothetical protein